MICSLTLIWIKPLIDTFQTHERIALSKVSYGVSTVSTLEKIDSVMKELQCIQGLVQDCSNSIANAME